MPGDAEAGAVPPDEQEPLFAVRTDVHQDRRGQYLSFHVVNVSPLTVTSFTVDFVRRDSYCPVGLPEPEATLLCRDEAVRRPFEVRRRIRSHLRPAPEGILPDGFDLRSGLPPPPGSPRMLPVEPPGARVCCFRPHDLIREIPSYTRAKVGRWWRTHVTTVHFQGGGTWHGDAPPQYAWPCDELCRSLEF
jgi:hypothetical protein